MFPSGLLLLLAFYKNSAGSDMICHDRRMEFKTSKYHSKGDEIRLGLGVT